MAKLRSTLVLSKRVHAGVTAPPQYLSGLDIFHGHVGLPAALVYKNGLDIDVALRGLTEVLKHYPIITGRYKRGEQGHVYVDCNDAGIDFRVHKCKGPMPYGERNPLGTDIKQFFKHLMPWQVIGKDTALLQLDVYEYEDKGVVLICYPLHSLFDGASFWVFMQNWSRACLGQEIKPPALDRQVLIDAGKVDPGQAKYELIFAPPLRRFIGIMLKLGWRALTDMQKEVFRIPASTVQKWKDQVKVELPDSAGVSTAELVTVYVMKALSPVLPHGVDRTVGMVLDLRYRRRLKLPRDYFGNALAWTDARFTEQELAQQSLPVLAEKCRPSAEQLSTESLVSLLVLTEQYRQKKALWRLIFQPTVKTLEAGIIQNNMIQLPVYESNLGSGAPDWFDIIPVTLRMMMIFPTPQQDGGMDLHITARKVELKRLREQMQADGIMR